MKPYIEKIFIVVFLFVMLSIGGVPIVQAITGSVSSKTCLARQVDTIGLVQICDTLEVIYKKNTHIDLDNITCNVVENKKIIKSMNYSETLRYVVALGKGLE